MVTQLQANLPVLIGTYEGVVTIYVRQYGAGNLRLGVNDKDLLQGVALAPGQVVDGIPQAAAAGIVQYFWSGDLWLISDAAGPVMVLAPNQSQFINRLNTFAKPSSVMLPSEVEGNLSTYQIQGV